MDQPVDGLIDELFGCTGWSVGWHLGQSVDWLTRENTGIPETGV